MSKYTYTVNSIKALKENTQNRVSQYLDKVQGLLEYGYQANDDLDYLVRNCNSNTELVETAEQWAIDVAIQDAANSFDFMAATVGIGAGNVVDVAMLIPSYGVDVADDLYTNMYVKLANYFGFKVDTSEWETWKKYYAEMSKDAFSNTAMLLSDDGNYYVDHESMEKAYQTYAEAWNGNGVAYSTVSGNRIRGTLAGAVTVDATGVRWGVDYNLGFVGSFTPSANAKAFVSQFATITESGRANVYSIHLIAPRGETVSWTFNWTWLRNGEVWTSSNYPNWGGTGTAVKSYSTPNTGNNRITLTIDGVEYVDYNTQLMTYLPSSTSDPNQDVAFVASDVYPSQRPGAYFHIFPPYNGNEYGIIPVSQGYSATAATVKRSLSEITNTTHPTPSGSVRTTYPSWYGSRKTRTIDKDGDPETREFYYYPVLPLNDTIIHNIDDTTINKLYQINNYYTINDKDTMIDIDIVDDGNEDSSDTSDNNPSNNPSPSGSDSGSTDTPSIIIPSVSSNDTGFVAIYHPTKAIVKSFSQWLWSVGFDLETFKKLFQDPMSAIISLHQIYATPEDETTNTTIQLGYINTNISCSYTKDTAITLDCGSIIIPEVYKNALDYEPAAEASIYLPFIGFRKISVNDIMNNTVNVSYNIDLITGNCVAFIVVNRGTYQAILYTFNGNCSVELPITAANFSNIISNGIGLAASIGAAAMTGGIAAPMVIGVTANAISNSKISIEHGGSLSGNVGSLAGKKPYIIVTRPRNKTALNYHKFAGYPTSSNVKLSNCSGFTRVKEIILDDIDATEDEKIELEQLLKKGVIF